MKKDRVKSQKGLIILFVIIVSFICLAIGIREIIINENIISDTYVIGSYGETTWNPRHITINMHNTDTNDAWVFEYNTDAFDTVCMDNNFVELTPCNVDDGVYTIIIGYNNKKPCSCSVKIKDGQIERVSTVATEETKTTKAIKEVSC